jgi:hypothetical protein
MRIAAPLTMAALVAALVVAPTSAAHADTLQLNEVFGMLQTAPADFAGYDRSAFGSGWTDPDHDGCDTRADVLKASSSVPVTYTDVSGCTVATGNWTSWYDGVAYSDASQLQIDQLVPPGEAWASGASSWTSAQRVAFANDVSVPYELHAVTASLTEAKGDDDPASWLPPSTDVQCRYVTDWVLEKYRWSLNVDPAEVRAIAIFLEQTQSWCGTQDVTLPAVMIPLVPILGTGTNDRLGPSTNMPFGQQIVSQNRTFTLVMQPDGNLVEYNSAHGVIWNSRTSGHPGATAEMQPDGNLVVYSSRNVPLWNSGTSGRAGSYAVLQNDGNLVIYQGTTPVFSGFADQPPSPNLIDTTPTSQWVLPAGSQLSAGEQLAHGSYRAVMQGDGNFVVYKGSTPLWWTRTAIAGSVLKVQDDGNMVVYAPDGTALWTALASGANSRLKMQLDGNLVLYRDDGSPSWYRLHDTGYLIPPPPPPAPPASQYTLSAGSQMNGGEQLTYGSYRAAMQTDGNFVVYNSNSAVWASNTGGNAGGYLRLQSDGNLVIYAAAGYPIWATMTSGTSRLVMQPDGNLVAYRADGSPAWYRLHDTSVHIAPPGSGGGSGGQPGNPGDTKNCSDFSTWAQAQSWFNTYFPQYGDVAKLDQDNDGTACESLPGAP